VVGRIERGFRFRFRELLALVRPRRLDFGVDLLIGRGLELSRRRGIPIAHGLAEVYEFTRVRVERRLRVTGACALVHPTWDRFTRSVPRFLSELSLAGLARWLRAAGYDAAWSITAAADYLDGEPSPDRVLLTSDCRVLERRAAHEEGRTVLWIPSALSPREQLPMVLRDLGLARREPRCMACGGALDPVAKGEVAARIPPRTALWLDDYTVCRACGHLYWRGTHWDRISKTLAAIA
jgi:uncharacterized protein with PIN domain